MKLSLIVICIVYFGNVISVYGQDRPFVVVSEVIPPFEYLDANGQPTGINVDLSKMIFERLGIEAEFIVRSEGDRALSRAQNNQVDAILSISYVPQREEYLLYPPGFENGENYMWISEYVFFVQLGDRDRFRNLTFDDIRKQGLTVGVIEGVSYEPEFWEAELNVIKSVNERENFQRLIDGEVDLVLTDRTLGDAAVRRMGVRDELEILPQSYFSKPYTIAFVKGSDYPNKEELIEKYFAELEDLRARGVARNVFLKHIRRR